MIPGDVNDVMPGSAGWGFWDLRKAVSWVPASEEEGWLSGLVEARPVVCGWVPHVVGGRWKSQHRKIVLLSPHVEKPLNSKRWIKVSYLNQFHVFGFLYMFLWTFYEHYIYFTYLYHGYVTDISISYSANFHITEKNSTYRHLAIKNLFQLPTL